MGMVLLFTFVDRVYFCVHQTDFLAMVTYVCVRLWVLLLIIFKYFQDPQELLDAN